MGWIRGGGSTAWGTRVRRQGNLSHLKEGEEDAVGVPLHRPIQHAAAHFELVGRRSLVEEGSRVELEGQVDDGGVGREEPALVDARAQHREARLPVAIKARRPRGEAEHVRWQRRDEQVEDAERQHGRRSHDLAANAIEFDALGLEVADVVPRVEHLPHALHDTVLQHHDHAHAQRANALHDLLAGPLAVQGGEALGLLHPAEAFFQLVVGERANAAQRAHDRVMQREGAPHVPPREAVRRTQLLARRLLLGALDEDGLGSLKTVGEQGVRALAEAELGGAPALCHLQLHSAVARCSWGERRRGH
eukprot:139152-Prymnesium_polylepis.1